METSNRRTFVELVGAVSASLPAACDGPKGSQAPGSEQAVGELERKRPPHQTLARSLPRALCRRGVVQLVEQHGRHRRAQRFGHRAQAFEVVPQTPYLEAYDDCADLALQEA